jgi:hypothetical protein
MQADLHHTADLCNKVKGTSTQIVKDPGKSPVEVGWDVNLAWCYNQAQYFCDLDGAPSSQWEQFKNECINVGSALDQGCDWKQC